MPLTKSKSKQAFKSNVSEMVKAGHPVKQALAAAYSIKGEKAEGGVLDANARAHIKKDNFALPGGRYPIEDASHARNALARVSQNGSSNEKKRVRAAVHRKYPSIEESESKASGGVVMNNDKMMSDLMKRRKAKMMAEGGEAYDYGMMDQDEMPSLHEKPDDAKMNNQDPNLQEQSRHDMGDNDDSEFDHKLSAEGREDERESALYADGGSAQPPIDPDKAQSAQDSMRQAFKYAPGGKVKMAYGQGRSEEDQEDNPQTHDEDSSIAYAEGGIAYNSNLKENEQDDTAEDHDEASRIAYAQGGTVQGAKRLENNDEDTKESKDEASDITMAEGGSVEHALRLKPDMEDTAEDHDEASSIAMARGGVAYNDGLTEDEGQDPELLHNEEQYAGGGQVDDNQDPSRNPKSFQNEDEQESAMKARRRKLMISALNE
jgi:hypothetical protein